MRKFILSAIWGLMGMAAMAQDGGLLIWINGDKPYTALQALGDQFEKDNGVPVTVQHPTDLPAKFGPAAQSGKGPDIVIWAHDRLGGWAQSGLLSPVNVPEDFKAKFHPKGWEAANYNGQLWGYPITMEVVTLIYNKALIQNPPKLLSETFELSKQYNDKGQYTMLWAYDTPYFTWPFLAGGGAYVFGKDAAGNYNLSDVGVNAPGAVKALETIAEMIQKGVMPKGVSYDVMAAQMQQGKCAMCVNGPWMWNDLKKAGIDFGIGVIPGVDGPSKPFVGILTAMLNASSPSKDLAELFIKEYILTPNGLKAMNDDTYGGPPALTEAYNQQKAADPRMESSMQNIDVGVLMPNIPQMGSFWSSIEAAIKTVTSGQAKPREALDNAAKIIKAQK
ncbi:MAG TPA: maltose/maltodextrin ABC transporter substrate-binding protein MalE [Verrucomicrobia bacterium]|nr:MAG: maltose ABC transporter substrate-binding protein MalE [Lentisphaerae bacterium GWF2_57_35]HBA86281.1 maltose/maltodextrin ABC transporter substrate-binding protein MalE [Verrucomicrobiota bacterium]